MIFLKMFKSQYHLLGIMSGTSLDGVDMAYVTFNQIDGKWQFIIKIAETIPYPKKWHQTLDEAIKYNDLQLKELNQKYTDYLGNLINLFIQKNKLNQLDAICSHGHTIKHQPQDGFTLQIGNLPHLAKKTQQLIVCDFRVQDVMLGGQGAPLVPIGDHLLFPEYDYCLNLGGFCNVSFQENNTRIAYDICPANTVLNFYAQKLGHPFDVGGEIASNGKLNLNLFDALNKLDFYTSSYPKSLGVEFLHQNIFPIIESYPIAIEDVLNTFVEHIAFQISQEISKPQAKVLITGGGAYHAFLIKRIRHYREDVKFIIPEDKLIQYKEALIFAFLGLLKLRDEVNVLSSVTGAKHDHSSGEIYYP